MCYVMCVLLRIFLQLQSYVSSLWAAANCKHLLCVYSFIYSRNALYLLSLQSLSSKSRCKVAMVTPDMKMVCTHECEKSLCKQERLCWCGKHLRKRCCSSVIGFAWCLWSAESRGRSCGRSWPCGPAGSRHTAGTECLHGPRTAPQTTWHTEKNTGALGMCVCIFLRWKIHTHKYIPVSIGQQDDVYHMSSSARSFFSDQAELDTGSRGWYKLHLIHRKIEQVVRLCEIGFCAGNSGINSSGKCFIC